MYVYIYIYTYIYIYMYEYMCINICIYTGFLMETMGLDGGIFSLVGEG